MTGDNSSYNFQHYRSFTKIVGILTTVSNTPGWFSTKETKVNDDDDDDLIISYPALKYNNLILKITIKYIVDYICVIMDVEISLSAFIDRPVLSL